MRTICVVTGSRAEYGLLYWLLKEIQADPRLELQLVVTGMHLSPLFGMTYRNIEEDGFQIDLKVEIPLDDDSTLGITRSVGTSVIRLGEAFAALKPSIVVLLGDRFEVFAAATAAFISRIPIAHIHGGESTYGAFDESLRHAITKMSLLHFAATEPYRRRIIQMGESPERVFCVGAPALDNITKLPLLGQEDLERQISFSLGKPTFLVTYHPVTLENQTSEAHIGELLSALDAFPEAHILFTQVNADPDNRALRNRIEKYVQRHRDRVAICESLGTLKYLSAMKMVDVVVGNSSSGIIEAPAFRKPTVNIGDRQKGRLMADSVISCGESAGLIRSAIAKALSPEFQATLASVKNPYGEAGGASERIKNVLRDAPLSEAVLKKEFHSL